LSQSYDPFGNILQQGGTAQSIFGYAGEQTDPTQLVYLRARYYDPAAGRFLTADDIISNPLSSQGWNRYTYVENNPINYIDPSGRCIFVGIDTLACGEAVIILLSAGASLYLGYEVVTSDAYQDALHGAIDSMALDPNVPEAPTGVDLIPCPPDPAIYKPGPVLGGEFTGSLHLPGGSTADLPSLDTGLDFPTPSIQWPTILTAEKLKTYYGEVIEVDRLSDREVRELGLHDLKKSTKGTKASDHIYREPKTGRLWIRRGSGPLIEFP
jgi:RHS repeat-associated protein